MELTGKIIDVHQRRIYPGKITIRDGKIESVSESELNGGGFIMPGLADAHLHIESTMLLPSQFAVAAVRHGTVAAVADPHEIANVMGVEGITFMLDDAARVPVKTIFGAPSSVPATPHESAGAKIGASEIRSMLREGRVRFLAEMMNFPGVINDNPEVLRKLEAAREAGVVIDGHAPGVTGSDLKKYIDAGISTDHECISLDEALEKISGGMKILIREGSAAKNLEALAPLINYYPDMVMLCSDDLHPETLLSGHINRMVARLVTLGYDLFDVIRAATLNTFTHYGIDAGTLRPGDPADFIVVDDPAKMNVLETWIDGKCIFDGTTVHIHPVTPPLINTFRSHLIMEDEIKVINEKGKINLIVARDGDLITEAATAEAGDGPFVTARPDEDILKIVIKDRYNDRPPAAAFIRGFGLKRGAIASSVAHDSHNIIAIGTNDRDIVSAINMIIDASGGMAVVSDEGEELLRLPVAGLMSDLPATVMAAGSERLSASARRLGCRLEAPFMTLSFMALLVIPSLKMSDRGLFDGINFTHIPLFIPDPYRRFTS